MVSAPSAQVSREKELLLRFYVTTERAYGKTRLKIGGRLRHD